MLAYENKLNPIKEFIPLIEGFNNEILIGKLQGFEIRRLKYDFPIIESTFRASTHKNQRILTKGASTNSKTLGEYASNWEKMQENEIEDARANNWTILNRRFTYLFDFVSRKIQTALHIQNLAVDAEL